MAAPEWPVTGADVAAALNWDANRAAELQQYAAAAVSKIEAKVGPWHGQTLTHRVTARVARRAIVLPWPVAAVISVTVDGAEHRLGAVDVDEEAGIVHGPIGPGHVVIIAMARPAETVPEDVILAGQRLGAFLAKQEKVGPRAPGQAGSADRDTDVAQGFALPRAVSELIKDYVLRRGFA